METIGGHHWMARRVPDDVYVAMPNQLGIDTFVFDDPAHYLCSADLRAFVETNHLDLSLDGTFRPRLAFGSHDDADHVYNTPRAWFIERTWDPHTVKWDGADADHAPESDDIPWCMVPERKLTVEDVKYVLSSTFQGTPYDPYLSYGDRSLAGKYRAIGINRTSFLGLIQIRPQNDVLEWIAFASNPFNVLLPFYADVEKTPAYLADTNAAVSTDSFYWTSRLIAAMADASYSDSRSDIERYQAHVAAKSHEIIARYDALLAKQDNEEERLKLREQANEEISAMAREAAADTLDKVLFALSSCMKNAFARSDA